ncbi:MAG: hypothetical protein ABSA17_07285 [Rhabdochlamydiaceae bacterium]|jgi:hypothetical protein
MKIVRYFFIAVMLCCSCFAEAFLDTDVLTHVQSELSLSGVLESSGRFVYVKVDDDYVHKLVAIIEKEGFVEPPYFGSSDLVGAHISVIYPDEVQMYGIGEIEERGKVISFIPKECKVVHPPMWKGIDEVYLLVVEAPELEQIRAKYGLPKQKYDFHITIGVKPKAAA